MSDIVGIDLGTTNSLIGIMEAGFPILLADAEGERLLPSVVHFPLEGEPMIGRVAERARALAPRETISSIKRLMGRREAGAYEMHDGKIRVRDAHFAPEEISARILCQLKQNAEKALGRSVDRAVITVPAYFNDAQRLATKRAGEIAGFTVERILSEPTAAALAYGLDRLAEKSQVAVYDFGGGTFDLSILRLHEGVFEVLATNGNTQLGGDDLDSALVADCDLPIPEFEKRTLVIEAKHRLSREEEVRIELPFVAGRNYVYELTRARLEEIARPIVEKTRWHCARALADAKMSASDLDEIILVGGATRMPLVRAFAREFFGRAPNVSQNPDEAVAIGATIQAGILSGAVQGVVLLDVTPLSLGIETFGGLMNVIIPRNSTIPIKAGEMFTTAVSHQRAMSIHVLQGEREMARDNWPLGKFELEFEPAPKGVPRVGVQFAIDADGLLHVLARDTKTGREKELALTSAIEVTDEAVEKMLEDSLEHAFEDMSERNWTEATLKANEMLKAVGGARAIMAGQIGAAEDGAIAQAVAEVEAAIGEKNLLRLQRANANLDSATQSLAAAVLEKVTR